MNRLLYRDSKVDGDGCAAAGVALELELCAVVLRSVLHDGQAETRAADFLGVALVDAVEALEDAALVAYGMPMPVSTTESVTVWPFCQTETVTLPPEMLYLIALSQRL